MLPPCILVLSLHLHNLTLRNKDCENYPWMKGVSCWDIIYIHWCGQNMAFGRVAPFCRFCIASMNDITSWYTTLNAGDAVDKFVHDRGLFYPKDSNSLTCYYSHWQFDEIVSHSNLFISFYFEVAFFLVYLFIRKGLWTDLEGDILTFTMAWSVRRSGIHLGLLTLNLSYGLFCLFPADKPSWLDAIY